MTSEKITAADIIEMSQQYLIGVRYHGATDTKGSRFTVYRYPYGKPILLGSAGYDYAARDAHQGALYEVLNKLGIERFGEVELPGQVRYLEQVYLVTIPAEDTAKLLRS